MQSKLTYTPLNTWLNINERIETDETFFSRINDLMVSWENSVLPISEYTKMDEWLHIGKLITDEKILLLIAQQCPTLNSWLLHVLANNEKVSWGFNWVFMKIWDLDHPLKSVQFNADKVKELLDINIWTNSDWNSFLSIWVN